MTDYLSRTSPEYDANLASLVDELSLWSSHFGRLLLREVPLVPGQAVLDVGCGTGFPALELAQRLGPKARVVGVDTWPAALERARWKAGLIGLGHVTFVPSDGAALPFGAGTFDLVVSNIGINNFDAPAAVLAECGRVTRPGGRIALTTNPAGHLWEFYAAFEDTLIDLGKTARLPALRDQMGHRLRPAALEDMLRVAGFTPTRMAEDSFSVRFVDGSAFLNHFLTRAGFLAGWRSVLEPGEEEEVFARVEETLNRAAAAGGELEMTVPAAYLEAERRS